MEVEDLIKEVAQVFIMVQEINKIIRVYDTERNNDEIIFDVYDMILTKLDNDLLVKES